MTFRIRYRHRKKPIAWNGSDPLHHCPIFQFLGILWTKPLRWALDEIDDCRLGPLCLCIPIDLILGPRENGQRLLAVVKPFGEGWTLNHREIWPIWEMRPIVCIPPISQGLVSCPPLCASGSC